MRLTELSRANHPRIHSCIPVVILIAQWLWRQRTLPPGSKATQVHSYFDSGFVTAEKLESWRIETAVSFPSRHWSLNQILPLLRRIFRDCDAIDAPKLLRSLRAVDAVFASLRDIPGSLSGAFFLNISSMSSLRRDFYHTD